MSINQVVKVAMDNAYEMGKRDGRNEADAKYERLRQKNALLRNEVRAWRSGWYDDDASEGELARARAATDAAGALEDC